MVLMQNIHVLNCRSEKASAFKISLKKNILIPIVIISSILLQIIVMENKVLSSVLSTSKVPLINMVELLGFSSIILVVLEIFKYIKRKVKHPKN